jgi:hypothetical protein
LISPSLVSEEELVGVDTSVEDEQGRSHVVTDDDAGGVAPPAPLRESLSTPNAVATTPSSFDG